jgi:hypothetical protein
MPRVKQAQEAQAKGVREERIGLRVDAELFRAAYEKALQYGGLSAVIRAMLRKFVEGTINFDLEDLADENRRAQKGQRSK